MEYYGGLKWGVMSVVMLRSKEIEIKRKEVCTSLHGIAAGKNKTEGGLGADEGGCNTSRTKQTCHVSLWVVDYRQAKQAR